MALLSFFLFIQKSVAFFKLPKQFSKYLSVSLKACRWYCWLMLNFWLDVKLNQSNQAAFQYSFSRFFNREVNRLTGWWLLQQAYGSIVLLIWPGRNKMCSTQFNVVILWDWLPSYLDFSWIDASGGSYYCLLQPRCLDASEVCSNPEQNHYNWFWKHVSLFWQLFVHQRGFTELLGKILSDS